MKPNTPSPQPRRPAEDSLPVLEPAVIQRIRQALGRVGDFGEIGLVIVKGEIKFIRIICSESLAERPEG